MVQEGLEKNYQNNNDNAYFYDKVKDLLSNAMKTNDLLPTLGKLSEDLINDKNFEITRNHFTYLGALGYLVGIDFTSQEYVVEGVIKNVHSRFDSVFGEFRNDENLSQDLKMVGIYFASILDNIEPKNIESAKNSFKNKVEKIVKFKISKDKFEFYTIIGMIKTLINNGTLPVAIAKDINVIMLKENNEVTYFDLLKLNSFIHQNLSFDGTNIKRYINIHENTVYVRLLEEATEFFENRKLSVIYIDSILTVKENFERLNVTDNLTSTEFFAHVIFDKIDNIDFKGILESHEEYSKLIEKPEETVEEKPEETVEEKPEDVYIPIDNMEIQKIMAEQPDQAIIEVFKDIVKTNNFDIETITKSLDYLISDLEYGSNLYTYFKANQDSDKRKFNFLKIINKNILNETLEGIFKKHSDIYSEIVKKSCAVIPEEDLKTIVDLLDKTIDVLILKDMDTKQMLINQKFENAIETYQHLHQIVTFIENCEIKGTGLLTYTTFYDFIENNETTKNIFNSMLNIEQETTKLKIIGAVKDWFLIDWKPNKETPKK